MHFASGYKRINQAPSVFATITWFSGREERTRLSASCGGGTERSLMMMVVMEMMMIMMMVMIMMMMMMMMIRMMRCDDNDDGNGDAYHAGTNSRG